MAREKTLRKTISKSRGRGVETPKGAESGRRQKEPSALLLLVQIYDQGLIGPLLDQHTKIALCQTAKAWNARLGAHAPPGLNRGGWGGAVLAADAMTLGQRPLRSGRVMQLPPDDLYFRALAALAQPRFRRLRALNLRGCHLGPLVKMGAVAEHGGRGQGRWYPRLLATVACNGDLAANLEELDVGSCYMHSSGKDHHGILEQAVVELFPNLRHLAIELYSRNCASLLLQGLSELRSIEFVGRLHNTPSQPATKSLCSIKCANSIEKLTLRNVEAFPSVGDLPRIKKAFPFLEMLVLAPSSFCKVSALLNKLVDLLLQDGALPSFVVQLEVKCQGQERTVTNDINGKGIEELVGIFRIVYHYLRECPQTAQSSSTKFRVRTCKCNHEKLVTWFRRYRPETSPDDSEWQKEQAKKEKNEMVKRIAGFFEPDLAEGRFFVRSPSSRWRNAHCVFCTKKHT